MKEDEIALFVFRKIVESIKSARQEMNNGVKHKISFPEPFSISVNDLMHNFSYTTMEIDALDLINYDDFK